MPVPVTCIRCGMSFLRKPSHAARTKDAFCSRDCRKVRPSAELLRTLYVEDRKSSTEIATLYGVAFATVCGWLELYGIPRRSASEAKKLDMERWSYEDRLRLTAVSRRLINRGNKPHNWLCLKAKGVQEHPSISKYERMILDALETEGFHPIPQYAVDKYNIDLAFPLQKLAIEIDGGCWHNTPKKRASDMAKEAFLRAEGWRVRRLRTRRQDWVKRAVSAIRQFITE